MKWRWGAVLVLILFLGLATGAGTIHWSSLFAPSDLSSQGVTSRLLFWHLRFPRVLTAAAVGAGLAVVGAVLQSLLRNPLADPFLIGVSSASAAGTVVALAAGWLEARFGVSVGAALATLLLLDFMAFRRQRWNDHYLLVAGVAITYLFTAVTGLVVALADPEKTRGLLFWLMGGFFERDALGTGLSVAVLIAVCCFLFGKANDLDVLAAGDETAHVLGLRPHKLRRQLFFVSSLLVGIAVATAGGIGFVGMIVPHLARLSCGVNHRRLLILCALGGASLTVGADTLARTILSPREIPVGLITALVGAPFFLYQLHRGRGI